MFFSICLIIAINLVCICGYSINCCPTQGINTFNPSIISLEGTSNVRDLGGYITTDGYKTKPNILIRSAKTCFITDKDVEKLKKEHNLKYVIDVRSNQEIQSCPDKFKKSDYGVTYIEIPFDSVDDSVSVPERYLNILEKKELIKQFFETLSICNDGSILFHCSWGKDRTGVLSFLVLSLVNVCEDVIVKDYEISYELLKDDPFVKKVVEKKGLLSCLSAPEYLKQTIQYVKDNYTTTEEYLLSCKISRETLSNIKDKFVELDIVPEHNFSPVIPG